jgi:hypothetical protein
MALERVTITVRSNIGDEGSLTVQDALRQVLDFFDLLIAAQGDDDGQAVAWHLADISMHSPLTATGEPHALKPGVPVEVIARRGKESVKSALRSLSAGSVPPAWMRNREARNKAKNILKRNTNGVGRTDINFDDESPVEIIVEKTARAGLNALERTELEEQAAEADLSRTENGSIEGEITDTTTHYGHPAIKIRERLTKDEITVTLSRDLAERAGRVHNWSEVWAGKRVLVTGEISYGKTGAISRVFARDIQTIDPEPLRFEDIANPNFTAGRSIAEHLESLWSGEDD